MTTCIWCEKKLDCTKEVALWMSDVTPANEYLHHLCAVEAVREALLVTEEPK